MKKLLLYGLSLSLVFSFAACASKSAPSDADAATDAVQTDQSQENEADDLTQAISNVQQSADLAPMTNDELLALFDRVYQFSIKESWPEIFGDYLNCEFNLILKYSIDDGKELPADYKERYIDWRPLDDANTKSDQSLFYPDARTLYAVETANLHEHYSEDSKIAGSIAAGDSIHCIGVGIEGDVIGWRKIQLSDGGIVYVLSDYIIASKPDTSIYNSTASDGSTDSTPNGGSGNTGSNTGSSGKTDITKLHGYTEAPEVIPFDPSTMTTEGYKPGDPIFS